MYVWEHPDWPRWGVDSGRLLPLCSGFAERRGRLIGRLGALGSGLVAGQEAEVLADDATSTARVEGEGLPLGPLWSSIAGRVGLEGGWVGGPGSGRRDGRVEGLLEVLEDASRNGGEPLSHGRLYRWHRWLFEGGSGGRQLERIGAYRGGAIEVLSGSIGKPRIHFRAPPAERVEAEMERFLDWWNGSREQNPALTAGLAHLWFETIHPFEDGNGRIGRAIADLTLARADGRPRRAFSLSRQILEDQAEYYRALEAAQRVELDVGSSIDRHALEGAQADPEPAGQEPVRRGRVGRASATWAAADQALSNRDAAGDSGPRAALDATPWLEWFVGCLSRAVGHAEQSLQRASLRHQLGRQAGRLELNPRQLKVLERLIEAEPQGLTGDLTNRKYRSLTGASDTSASRDLRELLGKGLLSPTNARGRSTAYRLNPAGLAADARSVE